jgi:hypothetical protein
LSTDDRAFPVERRTLGWYIATLVERLTESDAPAIERVRGVVGRRCARIVLDREAVDVSFGERGFTVEPADEKRPIDGEGATDRMTVLDILDGYVEATDAILDGRIRISGATDDVVRMLQAIETLIDSAARAPDLQDLSMEFRFDPDREALRRPVPVIRPRSTAWFPDARAMGESALLDRLGLRP